MKKGHPLPLSAPLIAAAAALATIALGAGQLPYVVAASLPAFLALYVMESRLRRRMAVSRETDALIVALHLLHLDIHYNKRPVLGSITAAAKRLPPSASGIRSVLDEVRARLSLGQDVDESIRSCKYASRSVAADLLRDIANAYKAGFGFGDAAGNSYRQLVSKREEALERASAAVQKYTAMSMMLGTVLPSFSVFAFVGYSMVHYSPTMFTVFALALLVALPAAYAAIRMNMFGLYGW